MPKAAVDRAILDLVAELVLVLEPDRPVVLALPAAPVLVRVPATPVRARVAPEPEERLAATPKWVLSAEVALLENRLLASAPRELPATSSRGGRVPNLAGARLLLLLPQCNRQTAAGYAGQDRRCAPVGARFGFCYLNFRNSCHRTNLGLCHCSARDHLCILTTGKTDAKDLTTSEVIVAAIQDARC
jgi:hypothetical protein